MAATTRGIKAGEAYIRLFAEDSALRKGLESAEKRLRAFGTAIAAAGAGLTAVGASALGGLFAAAKTFSDVGDAVDKMNQRTGLSTEAISELGFAAEQEGTNIEELEKGFRKFQQTLGDAAKGNKEAAEAFAAIGLNVEQLLAMSPDEQFYAIADAMSKITDEAVLTEAAMGLLGRGGAMLIPLLTKGSAGIDELRRQARELGLTFDSEAAQSAAALNDALNALNRSLKATWMWIGSAVAPAITRMAEVLTPIVASVGELVKQNRGMVVTVGAAAAAIAGLGVVLVGVGGSIVALGLVLGGISTILGTIGAVGGALVAFLSSTLGVVLSISLAVGAASTYMVDWGEVVEWLGQQMRTLESIAGSAFKGIADALAYGDIQLAAQILWAGLEVIWLEGVQRLNVVWNELTYAAGTAINVIGGLFKAGIETAMHSVISTLLSGLQTAGNVLAGFATAINPALGATVGAGAAAFSAGVGGVLATEEARHAQAMLAIQIEMAKAQAALAQANAEDQAAAQERLDIAKAQLDALVAEAELRRRMTEQGKLQIDAMKELQLSSPAGDAVTSVTQAGFAGASLEAFRPDALKSPIERTAKATEKTATATQQIVAEIRQSRPFVFA